MCPARMQGMAQLTKLIFQRAQPKRLGSQVITGPMLATLASEYVRAINEGAVPTISTAWQVWLIPASLLPYSGAPSQVPYCIVLSKNAFSKHTSELYQICTRAAQGCESWGHQQPLHSFQSCSSAIIGTHVRCCQNMQTRR